MSKKDNDIGYDAPLGSRNNQTENQEIDEASMYEEAKQLLESRSEKIDTFRRAKAILEQIPDYRNSSKLMEQCNEKILHLNKLEDEKKRKKKKLIGTVLAIVAVCIVALLVVARTSNQNSAAQEILDQAQEYIDRAKAETTDLNRKDRFYSSAEEKFNDKALGGKYVYRIFDLRVDRVYEELEANRFERAIEILNLISKSQDPDNKAKALKAHDDIIAAITAKAEKEYAEKKYSESISTYRYLLDRSLDYDENQVYDKVTQIQLTVLSTAKDGDVVKFGVYEQDGEYYDGDDIEWIVIGVENGEFLLISKDVIMANSYHTDDTSITWKDSSIRKYLNSRFIEEAFTDSEKSYLVSNKVDGSDDLVYILSKAEAEKCMTAEELIAKASQYANQRLGVPVDANGTALAWWLRDTNGADALTVGADGKVSTVVGEDGTATDFGYIVTREGVGIRPVIKVKPVK